MSSLPREYKCNTNVILMGVEACLNNNNFECLMCLNAFIVYLQHVLDGVHIVMKISP